MEPLKHAIDAIRRRAREPLYSSVVVLTLALVLGANTATFGVVHAVLLAPLPVRAPEDLVLAWESDPSRSLTVVEIPYRRFERWGTHGTAFVQSAAMGSSLWPAVLRDAGDPARVSTAGVSGSFFETLGVSPMLGRALGRDDDQPNAPDVAVLSHGTWIERFGGDPAVIGRGVSLDRRRTVVGVMPREFDFPRGADFWIPIGPVLETVRRPGLDPFEDVNVLFFIGRLRPGVSRLAAADELGAGALASRGPDAPGRRVVATSFLEYLQGPIRPALWALWGAVGALLLIACANVSGLMLTRVVLRRHDHAIRLALGASRTRLRGMWALESFVVTVAGGVAGWMIALWLIDAIVALAPADVPRLERAALDPVAGIFTSLAIVLTSVLCALGPARLAASASLADALADSPRASPGPRGRRTRSALVAIQIALAVVLLVLAGLIARSFSALRQLDPGFVPSGVVTMFVDAPSSGWMRDLIGRLEASAQVDSAGAIYLRPLELGPIGQEVQVTLEGQGDDPAARQANPMLNYQVATPGFFPAMRIRLLRGRLFTDGDDSRSERVAIVGESTARRLWPGEDPVGRRMLLPAFTGDGARAWRTVVGVVGDVTYRGLGDVRLDVYDAAWQSASIPSYLVVRTIGDPVAAVSTIRSEVKQIGPGVVVDSIRPLESVVLAAMAPWRFSTWILSVFAVLGFLLAATGLFGVVTLDVTSRRHELAVRLALGAGHGHLIGACSAPPSGRSWLAYRPACWRPPPVLMRCGACCSG